MIEIVDHYFGCGGEPWIVIQDYDNSPWDYSAVLEQLFAQMMGWC